MNEDERDVTELISEEEQNGEQVFCNHRRVLRKTVCCCSN